MSWLMILGSVTLTAVMAAVVAVVLLLWMRRSKQQQQQPSADTTKAKIAALRAAEDKEVAAKRAEIARARAEAQALAAGQPDPALQSTLQQDLAALQQAEENYQKAQADLAAAQQQAATEQQRQQQTQQDLETQQRVLDKIKTFSYAAGQYYSGAPQLGPPESTPALPADAVDKNEFCRTQCASSDSCTLYVVRKAGCELYAVDTTQYANQLLLTAPPASAADVVGVGGDRRLFNVDASAAAAAAPEPAEPAKSTPAVLTPSTWVVTVPESSITDPAGVLVTGGKLSMTGGDDATLDFTKSKIAASHYNRRILYLQAHTKTAPTGPENGQCTLTVNDGPPVSSSFGLGTVIASTPNGFSCVWGDPLPPAGAQVCMTMDFQQVAVKNFCFKMI